MPLVQAINVAKSYSGPNGAYALKPTSVQIDHGEFVAMSRPPAPANRH